MTLSNSITGKSAITSRILKAMSIFGGVEVMNMLCSVVRVKLVAMWLGPAGVGLFGIFNNALSMVTSVAQMGMGISAVRDIASHRGDLSHRDRVVQVVRRWGWLLGSLGAVAMMLLSPLLSRVTFGDTSQTANYLLLGVSVLLGSLSAAERAVMQGLDLLKSLARASLLGNLVAVAVSIPVIYIWRMEAIVPTILISYLSVLGMYLAFREKGPGESARLDMRTTLRLGKGFIRLGAYIVCADAVSQLLSYVFISYLNQRGGTADVGYYQAGYMIANRYVGMIFTGVLMEYYPRLASVAWSARRVSVFVSHEVTVLSWIMCLVCPVFILLAPLIVRVLYSGSFGVVVPFASIAMVGVVLRGVSYCIAYLLLAKNNGKVFLVSDISSAVIGLLLNIAGYRLWGILGLGVSYTVWYATYLVTVLYIYRRVYHMRLSPRALLAASSATFLTLATLLATLLLRQA